MFLLNGEQYQECCILQAHGSTARFALLLEIREGVKKMNSKVPSGILTLIIGLGPRLGLAVVAAIAGFLGYIFLNN